MHDFIQALAFNRTQSPFPAGGRRSAGPLLGVMRSFDDAPVSFRASPRQPGRNRRKGKGAGAK